jgi:beta-RFAP synthase
MAPPSLSREFDVASIANPHRVPQCSPAIRVAQNPSGHREERLTGLSVRAAEVVVTAPARLHLGFLDLNGGLGRRFGSIGLTINSPRTRLTVRAAHRGAVVGPEQERVRAGLAVMQRALGLAGEHRVTVEEAIPAHAGLGSGTRLALALATALRALHGLPSDLHGDAARLARGARSGVGIGLFQQGGLMVDGGHGPVAGPAPIMVRMPFPERWRVVLVLDPSCQGLHGADERNAFARLPPFPERSAADICRRVLMQALPALAEQDVAGFGAAIRAIQRILGDHFAPMQGGARFTSAAVGACLAALDRAGAHGVGQSSWGPTGFAFAASPEEAERLVGIARNHSGNALDIRVAAALNCGADIVRAVAAQPAAR